MKKPRGFSDDREETAAHAAFRITWGDGETPERIREEIERAPTGSLAVNKAIYRLRLDWPLARIYGCVPVISRPEVTPAPPEQKQGPIPATAGDWTDQDRNPRTPAGRSQTENESKKAAP